MNTYTLAQTDLEVSRLAYGCMRISRDADNGVRAVLTAYEQGITLYDHADIYGGGRSEEVFAGVWDASPGLREKIIVQSKCGIRSGQFDFSYEHIMQSVEGSLRRLKTDYLDILLLHRPDALVEPEEVARAFDALHLAGKVRYFGVSNHTVLQMELLRRSLNQPLIANQMQLGLLHSHMINEGIVANRDGEPAALATGILDYSRLNDILIQAWSPVAGGRLLNPSDNADERTKQTASLLTEFAEKKQTTKEAIALAWLLRHPAGIQPIIGTTRPERIEASCLADSVMLSRAEWYQLFIAGRGKNLP